MIFERGFKMNYKSGDLVKITGNCTWHNFNVGETVRLKRNCGGELHVWTAEHLDGHDFWHVMESDMAPVKPATMPQKIIITTDGKTTLARLFDGKTMVKRAEAKCAPSDVFDFGIGAELAVKRLMGEKPVTEPIKESDPVKLYCIESYRPGEWLTKGKIYELDVDGTIHYDDGYSKRFCDVRKNSSARRDLVPLVRRPARVGEWVYVIDHGTSRYEEKQIYKVFDTGSNSCVWFADGYKGNIPRGNYLVLDGYTGDPA